MLTLLGDKNKFNTLKCDYFNLGIQEATCLGKKKDSKCVKGRTLR